MKSTKSLLRCEAITYKFQHVPVKDVVVGESLPVEEVPEELAQVWVVGLIVEPQRPAEVQVGGKLGFGDKEVFKTLVLANTDVVPLFIGT